MNRLLMNCVVCGLAVCGTVATVWAEDAPRAQQVTSNRVGHPDQGAMTLRASQLIGTAIENEKGENVGTINDLVMDAKSADVRYVAVTYGGFLGVGNKMFAVPYEAFKCEMDPDNPGHHRVVLNVTPQQLEGAVGFDETHWPNFADDAFTTELYHRYKVKRRVDWKDQEQRDDAASQTPRKAQDEPARSAQ